MTQAVTLAQLVVAAPDGSQTGGIKIPRGTTAQRPAGSVTGVIRFNSSINALEIFDGSLWSKVSQQPPVFNTSSGSIGSLYSTQSGQTFDISVTADATPTFSIVAGSLPSGMSLGNGPGTNARISGTPGSGTAPDYGSTTYTFTIRATAVGLSADRQFTLTVNSRFVGFSCSTAGEGGTCSDTAPGAFFFTRVDFSSYGAPNGSCGSFSIGGCNAGSSNGYNPTPTKSYSVGANNGTWGDPCSGVSKRMYIQMSYGPIL